MSLDPGAVIGLDAEAVPGAQPIESAEKIQGGQSNPTYILHASDARYVSAPKARGRAAEIGPCGGAGIPRAAALAGTDVPVPRMLALCEDVSVIGSAFYVMEHVEGRAFDDPRLTDVPTAERLTFSRTWRAFLQLSIKLTSTGSACRITGHAATTTAARSTDGRGNTAPARPARSRPWTA
jgi:aminoglycoside phosphotransferase (APT) family kinase protein